MFILLSEDENQGRITEMVVDQKSNFLLAGQNQPHISQSKIIVTQSIDSVSS